LKEDTAEGDNYRGNNQMDTISAMIDLRRDIMALENVVKKMKEE